MLRHSWPGHAVGVSHSLMSVGTAGAVMGWGVVMGGGDSVGGWCVDGDAKDEPTDGGPMDVMTP